MNYGGRRSSKLAKNLSLLFENKFYQGINLLLTSVEEATGIDECFADSDLVRGFLQRDKATMAGRSEGKEKDELNDNLNDITNLLGEMVEQDELLITRSR